MRPARAAQRSRSGTLSSFQEGRAGGEFPAAENRKYTWAVDRFNSEGILVHDLLITLKNVRSVREARRVNTCLLCRRRGVNDSGLCEVCYGMLDGEPLNVAQRWLSGQGP